MSTPGLPVLKIAGALGLAVVVGGLGLGGNYAKNRFMGGGGKASTSSMGIDNTKKADPDKMILGAGTLARKWRSDAVFRSINIQKLESDGTVDLTKGNVSLEYFSPSGVTSFVKKQSDDSIKKFSFNDDRVTFKDIWGVKKRMETAPNATAMPACTTRMLAAKLAEKGLKPGKTAHVLLDPDLSMRGSLTWHVMSEDPKLDLHFDPMTCAPKS